jgi:site-specific recombinase XerD
LSSLRLEHMQLFRDWLPAQTEYDGKPMKMSASTVNRCLRVLKHFFRKHVQWGSIKESPCVYLDFLESDEKPRAVMSGEQYLLALEKAPAWFKPILEFVRLTGAPGSCIERLEWQHVDFKARQFEMLRKKGKLAKWKRVPLPMTDETFALLVALRNQNPQSVGTVFVDDRGCKILADRVSKVGNAAIRDAGLSGVTMYSLRHALASDLTNANVATEIVRQAMGHASIQTTQRYANKGGLQAVANALTQVRGGSLVAVSENGLRTQEEDFGT